MVAVALLNVFDLFSSTTVAVDAAQLQQLSVDESPRHKDVFDVFDLFTSTAVVDARYSTTAAPALIVDNPKYSSVVCTRV